MTRRAQGATSAGRTRLREVLRVATRAGADADLDALHEAFEALRDETDEPAALFALAAQEARALRALGRRVRGGGYDEALAGALLRVAEGSAEGAVARELAWASAELEARAPRLARALDASAAVRALAAATNGYALAGKRAAARRACARWARRARALGDGGEAYEGALAAGYELALADEDYAAAIAQAEALARALRARDAAAEVQADALAPLGALYLHVDRPRPALRAARAYVDAARGARDGGARALRALLALAEVARVVDAWAAWGDAAREAVELARERLRTAPAAQEPFAQAQLAEALASSRDLALLLGNAGVAVRTAREALAASFAAEGPDGPSALLARYALGHALLASGAPREAAVEAEALLAALPPLPRGAADPELLAARCEVLALAARAHHGAGDLASARARGRTWLAHCARAPGVRPDPALQVLLAQLDVTSARGESGTKMLRGSRRGARAKA